MKTLQKNLGLGLLLAATSLAFFNSSCKKEPDTILEITVVDTAGFTIQDAKVVVFGQPTDTVSNRPTEVRFNDSLFTDLNGKARFNYSGYTKPGQAGFVTLNIFVSKFDVSGIGVARLEEGVTTKKIITVQ